MQIEQKRWTKKDGWQAFPSDGASPDLKNTAQLVLYFGATDVLKDKKRFAEIQAMYPKAQLVGASTAGEILGTQVTDSTIVLTAVAFAKAKVVCASVGITRADQSKDQAIALAKQLPAEGLVHLLVISEGQVINGTELVAGLVESLPKGVVTGGLAGDGSRFKETVVGLNAAPASGQIVLVGFYGRSLVISHGSQGGWDTFGPERLITRSNGVELFELDGRPALDLYKEYLGDQAKDLPASGLLFPLSIRPPEGGHSLVRTILNISPASNSLIFAGDMPQGWYGQFMKANFNRLIDGAASAADFAHQALGASEPDLAILISCVGRKLLLKQRIEEEIEAVEHSLGQRTALVGFYSYGEISPVMPTENQCELHNQTMTITTISER